MDGWILLLYGKTKINGEKILTTFYCLITMEYYSKIIATFAKSNVIRSGRFVCRPCVLCVYLSVSRITAKVISRLHENLIL